MLVAPVTLVVAVTAASGDRAHARRRRRQAARSQPPAQRGTRDHELGVRARGDAAASERSRALRRSARHGRLGGTVPARPPASSSATRRSCACASTTSRRSPARRSSAQQIATLSTAAASPRSSTRRRRWASARHRSRFASRPRKVQSAMTQLSAARHDRRPALRDRGSPGAGRHARVADRGDAAADRGDPGPAREHDALRREPRRPEVAARATPASS